MTVQLLRLIKAVIKKNAEISKLKMERDGQGSILQSANNDIRRMQIALSAKDAEIERLKAELRKRREET